MRVLALALFALAACQSGDGYNGPYPFQPVWTPPPAQAPATQTFIMPSGRMMNCTTIGTVTSCY